MFNNCKLIWFRFGNRGSEWFFIALLLAFSTSQTKCQVFPLKVSSEGSYLITKSKDPFLLNAASIELSRNGEGVSNILSRFSYQGVNAAFVTCKTKEVVFTKKGTPERELKKSITALKRLVRQAAQINMAVLVSPCDSAASLIKDNKKLYQSLLFKKFYRFKNIMWLLDEKDYIDELAVSRINPKQLKGISCTNCNIDSISAIDFQVFSDVNTLGYNSKKPSFLYIQTHIGAGDSAAHAVRVNAYSGILKGASGIVVNYPDRLQQAKNNSTYNPIPYHLKQFKRVYDSLSWYRLHDYPGFFSVPTDSLKYPVQSAISPDSSLVVVYISSAFTLPLNLSAFGSRVKLSWINAVTGNVFHSQASSTPVNQLFLPPVSEEKNLDWFLLLQPKIISKSE